MTMEPQEVEELFRDSSLDTICTDIASMRIRGAGRIGRSAAWGLRQAVMELPERVDVDTVWETLGKATDRLYLTRPTAVSLANALLFVRAGLESRRESIRTSEELRSATSELALEFNRMSHAAVASIARTGSELIGDGYVVQTICNSTAVVGTLIAAHDAGRVFRVRAAETRPRYQGRITAAQLAAAGIEVELVVDNAIRMFFSDVDQVLVGADTVCLSGELFNKVGTANLAHIAMEHGVPFHSCAEHYKFSPTAGTASDIVIEERDPGEVLPPELNKEAVRIRNPAFEATPPELITGIITDDGIVSPEDAPKIVRKHFGTGSIRDHLGPIRDGSG